MSQEYEEAVHAGERLTRYVRDIVEREHGDRFSVGDIDALTWTHGAQTLCTIPPGCSATLAHGFLVLENQQGEGTLIKLSLRPEEIQREVDEWCKPLGCAADVMGDLKAKQQAQTANAMPQMALCDGCSTNVPRSNATWVVGKWFCSACVPMPPWGEWFKPVGPVPDKLTPDTEVRIVGADFGAQVSDQLAKQRGIDKAAANEAMRVPTPAEKQAGYDQMADYFRKNGVL